MMTSRPQGRNLSRTGRGRSAPPNSFPSPSRMSNGTELARRSLVTAERGEKNKYKKKKYKESVKNDLSTALRPRAPARLDFFFFLVAFEKAPRSLGGV